MLSGEPAAESPEEKEPAVGGDRLPQATGSEEEQSDLQGGVCVATKEAVGANGGQRGGGIRTHAQQSHCPTHLPKIPAAQCGWQSSFHVPAIGHHTQQGTANRIFSRINHLHHHKTPADHESPQRGAALDAGPR